MLPLGATGRKTSSVVGGFGLLQNEKDVPLCGAEITLFSVR